MWVWSELMFLCCSLYCLLYAVVRGVIGDRTTALKQSSVGAIITVLLAIFLGPIISHSWPINWFSVYSHPVFVTYLNSLVSPLLILGLVMVSLIVIAIYTFPPEFARKRKRTTRSRKPTHKPRLTPIRKPRHTLTRKPEHWVPSLRQMTVALCSSCGSENNPTGKSCWHCGHSIKTAPQQTESVETAQRCVVCSGDILSKDRVMLCPSCQTQGHRAHLLEYVRVHAACPDCGQRLSSVQLIPTA